MNPEPSTPPDNGDDGKPKKKHYGSAFIEFHDGVLLHTGVALLYIDGTKVEVIDRLILSMCGLPYEDFPDGKETIVSSYPDNGMLYSLNSSIIGNWKDFNPEMDHPFSDESKERFWTVRKKVEDGVPPMEIYNEMVGDSGANINLNKDTIIDTAAAHQEPAVDERPLLTYTGKGKFKKELTPGNAYPLFKETNTHVWVLNDNGEIVSYPQTIFIEDEF